MQTRIATLTALALACGPVCQAVAQVRDTAAMGHKHTPGMTHGDSAYGAMQQRGKLAMGVDQYTSAHHFDDLPDGGRITLEREESDSAGVRQIRSHMREIAQAFGQGDFSTPMFVHDTVVPGTVVMKAKRTAITFTAGDTPRGGWVRITTRDAAAIQAVHDFLAYQRREHKAK